MKFKPGDKVRIKEGTRDSITNEALKDIDTLSTNGVFTIETTDTTWDPFQYIAKEFKKRWSWQEAGLELAQKYIEPDSIENRFEILDLW